MMKFIISTQLALTGSTRQVSSRLKNRKAAGMLEYALVALLSIAVFAALNLIFPNAVGSIFTRIVNTINTK